MPKLTGVRIIRGQDTFDVVYVPSLEHKETLRNLRNAEPVLLREAFCAAGVSGWLE